jgi:nucleoside-diphosphate-sugar epimerase
MNAFITGASGFVGSRLSDALTAAGWKVKAFDLRTRDDSSTGIEFIPGDVRDEALLRNIVQGADVVFHLASALGASRIGPAEFSAINAGGTRAVLEAARVNGVRRIVHFSSAGVLGHVKPGEVADEGYPLDPRDDYDRSKLEGERAALESAATGLDIVVIRPGWVYGPGDRRTFKLVRAIARGRFLQAGKGETLQTPIFIDDLVAGTILCAERGRGGEIYNLAGGEVLTVRQIAETIAAVVGRRLPRLHLPMGPTRVAAGLMSAAFGLIGKEAPLNPSRLAFFVHPKPLDNAKARTGLSFVPQTAFAEGMAQAVAWYRAAGWI